MFMIIDNVTPRFNIELTLLTINDITVTFIVKDNIIAGNHLQ
ncbi:MULTISPECIES: hypothetical protein [Megasphaera]|nr:MULTISPECIES: hypothetical protein [Megasphaera]MCQ5262748.1 hypothetical protein [Megasphaera massiliensis]MCQ5333215.1 hypothetical protein [Megasphaera massiliensis]